MTLWTSAEAEAATWAKPARLLTCRAFDRHPHLEGGDLFVALKGDNRDGHDLSAPLSKPRRARRWSRAPERRKRPLLTVGHTQRGLEDLARAARARSNAKILAVTGSAGKTTTKEILRWPAMRWAAPMPRPRPTTIIGACR
jgi:UDP-N-acetylmuramoyl-tripeptide--D-alanyl-D-alanine ligase